MKYFNAAQKTKLLLLDSVFSISLNILTGQNLEVVDTGYEWGEIDIMVNEYNILTPYSESVFRSKVGSNFTEFTDTNDTLFLEFGYNEFIYVYGESSVIVNDEWGVSDIQIKDNNLTINGIGIGVSIEKAKAAFPKHEIMTEAIRVFYGGGAVLRFEYNPSGEITNISFLVRT